MVRTNAAQFPNRMNTLACITFTLALSTPIVALTSEVRVIGHMRRMFMAHDIGPNVELRKVTQEPHLYALGPLAQLKGEITVVDGQVFVSKANGNQAIVTLDPAAKAIFLVYASVPAWRSISVPTNVATENGPRNLFGSFTIAESPLPFSRARNRSAREVSHPELPRQSPGPDSRSSR